MNTTAAPNFSLHDQTGVLRSLNDYKGRWLVVYFYAKDESLGCTQQACSFRDEYRVIQQFGNAQVIGINHASVQSHAKFAHDHRLQFPILSDPDHVITDKYNAWSKLRAKLFGDNVGTARNTYLINPEGMIVKVYTGVRRSAKHTEQVITDLQHMQALPTK